GEIQCIGATTFDEYRKYIEKDAALARRFQAITVDPPSDEQTIEILKGLRDRYEQHHRVKITDAAVKAAVDLSGRYITGRVQPDKSIDVIDEAGARVRIKSMTKPPNLAEIEGDIERLSVSKDEAVKAADYERAAELRDQAEQLRRKKEELQKEWRTKAQAVDGVVDEEVVAEVVSKMTGVPLQRLEKNEAQRLLELEKELHKKVISQDEAIKAIAKSIRRARAGLKDPKRPMGSFIFVGPTGVGKTLLAKALAEFMFGDEEALIHLDMSEYMEKHNVSRLVGAPPGYVGYEEGGQLTERIRRRPYSVVLLDEVEKAHPDVFNMLLQIMEEGRLTDSFGRNVDFRNTIMIMTSNLGADLIKGGAGFGFQKRTEAGDYDNIKVVLAKEIERFFRPEFINRLDDVIVFRPLTKADITNIIDYEVAKVSKRLKQQKIEIGIDELAKEFLIERGYNPEYGARPLRRAIGQYVEDPLSEMLLQGDFSPPCKIMITHKKPAEGDTTAKADDHLYFKTEQVVVPETPAEPKQSKPEAAGQST
ncbi:MAG: ATP-dependent Clp protease ATP-binding subunit, partial [Phycisphaeraceae bacterium]|nr:ATP-dependent Clp protease ATP-binding subunit [Phycisphaeraceae bacterium]